LEPKRPNDPDHLGNWRITGRLGEGGFGTVFLAEKGAQKAAIKVIKDEFVGGVEGRARLASEAHILSELSDPYIGRIIDSDIDGEIPWIATEFVNGPTLEDQIRYEGPLAELRWFNLAANLFHALVTAHEAGIIHKDIKPSNIILGETGNKVIDFGIAHISGLTQTINFGDREGSTPFSSPEHFTPKTYPAMDVFSAAATMAYAGKGSSIWSGESELQLMRNINEDEPDLSGLTENEIVFLRPLLNKNPSDRPSARECLNVLLEYHSKISEGTEGNAFKAWSGKVRLLTTKKSGILKGIAASTVLILGIGTAVALINQPVTIVDSKAKASQTLPNIKVKTSAVASASSTLDTSSPSSTPKEKPSSKYGTKDDLATPFIDESQFSQQTLNDTNSCRKLADVDLFDQAIALCLKSAAAGDPVAYRYLGYSYNGKHEYAKAISSFRKAVAGKDVSSYFFLAPLLDLYSHDFNGAVATYKKGLSLDPGTLYYAALGEIYNRNKDQKNAKKYFLLASNNGEIDGIYDLGKFYYDASNWDKAKSYLTKAADSGNSSAMFQLGELYYTVDRDTPKACTWYKKGDQLKNIDATTAYTSRCKGIRLTFPDAPNVQTLNIFGRPFKSADGLSWLIPLNISGSDPIPAVNGVQFRVYNSGVPWFSIPFTILTQATGSSTVVDDLLFLILFKKEICPEFRMVDEENGQVQTIWTNGLPGCATGNP
jgi:serine/threonine protein kinase